MCKLAFAKTVDGSAYETVLRMLEHQENVVAGHSTGVAWQDKQGAHLRKAVGKVLNFKAKYPDTPRSHTALGHSRYATVGAITEDNQHPISLMFNGKRIGYAIHNGHWADYANYEYLRNRNLVNKTDSALIFTIYTKILEKAGNTKNGRRKALATLQQFLSGTVTASQNLILMFDDGQVIFSGFKLTYSQGEDGVGIMTFGFKNEVEAQKIYEVSQMRVLKFNAMPIKIDITSKPPKPTEKINVVPTCGIGSIGQTTKTAKEQTQLNLWKKIDKKKWRLVLENAFNQNNAKNYGELMKKRYNTNYRVVINSRGRYSVYVRRKDYQKVKSK